MPDDPNKDFHARLAQEHREAVARGEHDGQCEYLADPGFFLCNCSKRRREARGLTTPPRLEYQSPICLGCNEEAEHDGDCFTCPRCCTSWDTAGDDDHGSFYDDYGDLAAELVQRREQRAALAAKTVAGG